ncbi:hypothetical protein, partial [Rhizobium ruizarguesonis]|uniref:hypothetical protein n=1 Tax=Rhizobium ruizarguesonis TaxID=2081791 RepID=UPI001A8D105B
LKSCFDWRFSFSAIAFTIIGSLRNFRSGKFSADGQHRVKRKNLRQAHISSGHHRELRTAAMSLLRKLPEHERYLRMASFAGLSSVKFTMPAHALNPSAAMDRPHR